MGLQGLSLKTNHFPIRTPVNWYHQELNPTEASRPFWLAPKTLLRQVSTRLQAQ